MVTRALIACSLAALFGQSLALLEPNCNGKQTIVHLFEWTWSSIAYECETYLGPAGFCGTSDSPICTKNVLLICFFLSLNFQVFRFLHQTSTLSWATTATRGGSAISQWAINSTLGRELKPSSLTWCKGAMLRGSGTIEAFSNYII